MDRYKTIIPIHGLRRADPVHPRMPIGVGEVIMLPEILARSLLRAGSVHPSEDDITIDLAWEDEPGWVRADDREALIAAIEALGCDGVSQPWTNEQALGDLAWRLNGHGLDPEAVRALLPPLVPAEPRADLADAPSDDDTAKPAARRKPKTS